MVIRQRCCILVCKAHSVVQSKSLLGGLRACPPRKYLQNKHYEIESETAFNCLSLNLIHIHFTVIFLQYLYKYAYIAYMIYKQSVYCNYSFGKC